MRKYLRIICGLFRLVKELCLNFGRLKIHGFKYCISSGVKIWVHNGGKCDLGRKNWLSENCIIESAGGELVLGINNYFNSNCRVVAMERVMIGDNNLFGPNVVILDHNHNYSDSGKLICKQGVSTAPVTIGSDVWLCANVVICAGVTITDHVVIGANSVVTKSILEPGVYAGCPAKKIK